MSDKSADIAIIGGGIVGIAHALAAAKRGLKVVLFERNKQAVGASIRNFGLLWPIGQAEGKLYQRALKSREIWQDLAHKTGIYFKDTGSLHLAYHQDELDVLEEFDSHAKSRIEGAKLLTSLETPLYSRGVNPSKLVGAYFSPNEVMVDPREAVALLPAWLETQYGVNLQFSTNVNAINLPKIETTQGVWSVSQAIVCSGQDFEMLYPEAFAKEPITRCKLQMLATISQPDDWSLGASLCAGLTFLHYDNFKVCTSLTALKERFMHTHPFYLEHGIHVLLSQNSKRELIIGDSHHYDLVVDPFDREDINQAILDYLNTFALYPNIEISRRWNGIYPKLKSGTEMILSPAPGVTLVNGLGGAGMTLSFGLAEEVLSKLNP
jgi:FAD dependent oxidoreductase TIGR03364